MSNEVQNTDIKCSPGVQLTDLQKLHVGIVLDLFQAKPSHYKLDMFAEDGIYEDVFATCKGRREIGGQFFGLPVVTKESVTEHHEVTKVNSDGQMDVELHQRFTFKPAGTFTMKTVIMIWSDATSGKITRLQDRPMDQIPSNSLIHAMRKANAVITPYIVNPPKDE